MADEITTRTEISDVSLDAIATIVQRELIQAGVLTGTVSDWSRFAIPGSDSVKVPRTASFQVEKKQAAQKATKQKLTFASDSIVYDQHAVVQALVEDVAAIEAAVPVVAEYLRRMARAEALQVDKDIYAQMVLTSSSSPDHRIAYASGSALTKADFTEARRLLGVANVPMDDQLFLAINHDNEKAILGLADFVDADKWMSGSESAKLNGVLGRAYGFNIVVTNAVTDNYGLFYHREHVGIAFQMQPRIQEQYMLEHLGLLVSLDQKYGVKVLNQGKMGVLVGSAS